LILRSLEVTVVRRSIKGLIMALKNLEKSLIYDRTRSISWLILGGVVTYCVGVRSGRTVFMKGGGW